MQEAEGYRARVVDTAQGDASRFSSVLTEYNRAPAVTREANELYAKTFAIVADPDLSKPPANYPPYAEARMIRNDLAWMAANRSRILAEWTRRYGGKSIAP